MSHQVIDESVALQWCQQQRPLLLRVLASFYQQHMQYLETMSLTPQQTQQLAHDLKSTAPSCGATALTVLANRIAPPAPAPNATEQDRLLSSLAAVLHCIEQQYPDALALIQSRQKDHLEELRHALEQHNLRAVTMFQDWADQHANNWPEAVRTDVQHALSSFDFRRALTLLNNAVSEYDGI